MKHPFVWPVVLIGLIFSSCRMNCDFDNDVKLWKVFSDSGKNCSYLLGTSHIMPSNYIDSIPGLLSILDEVDVVMLECSNYEDTLSRITPDRLPDGQDYLTLFRCKDDYNYFIDFLYDHRSMNLHFQRLSPGYISLILVQKGIQLALPESFCGIERSLENWAIIKGKQRRFLESGSKSFEYASAYYTNDGRMPLSEQADTLLNIMKSFDRDVFEMKECLASISNITFKDYYNIGYNTLSENSPIYDKLVKRRNIEWIKIIEPSMLEGQCLIAVGDGHLRGKYGILKLLKEKGFRIEPYY